jgi:hypothetical protein
MNLIILPRNRADASRATRFLDSLPADKAWAVEVREHKPRRTDQQNRFLWGVCYATILREGGEALGGWTADDLHEHYLAKHFGTETLELAGSVYERPLRRSSRLNKQDFADFVAFIQREAAGMGIYIKDPDEYLAEAVK